MSTTLKWIIGIVVAAIVGVAIGAVAFHSGAPAINYGINNGAAVQNYPFWFTNGFYAGPNQQFSISASGQTTLGTTGTPFTHLNNGTCYIQPYAATIAASSSASVDCQATQATGGLTTAKDTALTGVFSGDTVIGTLGSTTAGTTFGGLDLLYTAASSTNGYITFEVFNQTGTTYTWSTTAAASGTATYILIH